MTKKTDLDRDLDAFGRFAEPALLILISLAEGPKHGYAMIEDIAGLSGERLGPGTLYGALARLESRSFVEPIESDARRNPYRITAIGEKALKVRLAALESVTKVAQRRLARA